MSQRSSISDLFAQALRIPEGPERDSWIIEVCGGDEAREHELRQLLEAQQTKTVIADARSQGASATETAPAPPGETPPASVGAFRIEAEIGRGGMGVVYRATDVRLDRKVAMKALPAFMASDPRRLARFQQEAKTLASLHHTNIASIFGLEEIDGRQYLVLEYVGGETLEERLRKGPLPVDETMTIGAQIAAGVAAAHDSGVVHRDLKPANIKITPDGDAKVLDFGLAKMKEDVEQTAETPRAASPVLTMEGAVMGTPAYMSPEQARGRTVDQRTDVWSFGVILLECLTGTACFRTDSAEDSIKAILNKPISLDGMPAETTPVVRHVLQRCLERDRSKRLRDMHDVRLALEYDTSSTEIPVAGTAPRRIHTLSTVVAALALVIAMLAIGFFSGRWSTGPAVEPSRPVVQLFAPTSLHSPMVAISPDGRQVAYLDTDGMPDAPQAIYLRNLDAMIARRLPGTDHAGTFRFSPDGSQIAFFWKDPTSSRTQLRVIDLDGGEPIVVLTDTGGERFETSWSRPGWFSSTHLAVFERGHDPALYRVPVDLGASLSDEYELDIFAQVEPGENRRRAADAVAVPGQDYLLYTQLDQSAQMWRSSIHRIDRDGSDLVLDDASRAVVTSSGQLVFRRGSTIAGVEFDLATGTVVGEPITLLADFQTGSFGYSDDGTLVRARVSRGAEDRRLMAIRRNGEPTLLTATTANYRAVLAPSPDGTEIVVNVKDPLAGGNTRLRVVDLETGSTRSLPAPPDGAGVGTGNWLPDGRFSFATFEGPGDTQLYVVDSSRTSVELLLGGPDPIGNIYNPEFTADGRHVLFHFWPSDVRRGIYSMPLDGTMKPVPLLIGTQEQVPGVPRLSPDGRWLAYFVFPWTTQIQQAFIAVQPFSLDEDRSSERKVIARAGTPIWSADGSELFYVEPEPFDVMAVQVTTDPELTLSEPRKILDFGMMDAATIMGSFGVKVLADGRFVYVAEPEGGPDPHLHIVLNLDTKFGEQAPVPAEP